MVCLKEGIFFIEKKKRIVELKSKEEKVEKF